MVESLNEGNMMESNVVSPGLKIRVIQDVVVFRVNDSRQEARGGNSHLLVEYENLPNRNESEFYSGLKYWPFDPLDFETSLSACRQFLREFKLDDEQDRAVQIFFDYYD